MPEPAFITCGHAHLLHQVPPDLFYLSDHHLCDPVPGLDDLFLLGKINKDDFQFSPVNPNR